MYYLLFILLLIVISGCEPEPSPASSTTREAWPNSAEIIFQDAAVLKYQVEQHKLEQHRLDSIGVIGTPARSAEPRSGE